MGLRLFFVGMLFLVNPNINMIDIIPDFIGLGFIWFALSKLRDLSSDIATSRRTFSKLFWVEIVKMFAVLWICFYSTDSGFLLTFSFGFTIIEMLFYISALNSFFDGMMYLGTRYDSKHSLSSLEKAKRVTLSFIIIREILTFLPQLAYLYVQNGFGYILEPYIGVVLVISAVLQFVAGIVWIILLQEYRNSLKQDTLFIENMRTKYNEIIHSDKARFIKRTIKTGLFLFGCFTFLSFNIFIDGNPPIPPCLSAVACLLMIFAWRKLINFPYLLIGSSIAYGAASVVSEYYGKTLARKYYFSGISKSIDAYKMFTKVTMLSGFSAFLFCVLCISIAILMFQMIENHTGVNLKNELKSIIEREHRKKKALRKLCVVWIVFGIIASVSGAASTVSLYLWQPYWMIDLLIHLVWFCITLKFIFAFTEQVENRYI